jgi:hypothetical protein
MRSAFVAELLLAYLRLSHYSNMMMSETIHILKLGKLFLAFHSRSSILSTNMFVESRVREKKSMKRI